MINTAETIPPEELLSKINTNETIPPSETKEDTHVSLNVGESVADSYIVQSEIAGKGKQAEVYLTKRYGVSYVVKMYHNGWKPSAQLKNYLGTVTHPNVARVRESGEMKGNYYEIYSYYSAGTLENSGVVPYDVLAKVVIPSVNEGLHELHTNGFIHCDIKPANLFWGNNREKVVIGDCGISSYTNGKDRLIDVVRGTPEYAPMVKTLGWRAVYSPAYDYGSFGYVLCRLVLGYSILQGMTIEEMSLAKSKGIELPSTISGRIRSLIEGLLNPDEEQRWGYKEVKGWCEGEFHASNKKVFSARKKQKDPKPLLFGQVNGQMLTVTTLHQLENAVRENWAQARVIVKRRELVEFIAQFNENLRANIKELYYEQDADVAVFKLLNYTSDDKTGLFFCGKKYDSLSEYVNSLLDGNDETAKKFLTSGLLVFYLRNTENFDANEIDKLEVLTQKYGSGSTEDISKICYALLGKRDVSIDGSQINSLDELVTAIKDKSIDDINRMLDDSAFIGWLNRMGFEKETKKIQEMGR